MKSSFYKFSEYQVDIVQNLHDKWDSMKSKTQDIAGISKDPSKDNQNPHGLSYEHIKLEAIKYRRDTIKYDMENNFKKRHQITKLEQPSYSSGKDIYSSYRSRSAALPKDSTDPFIDDLIEYAKNEVIPSFFILWLYVNFFRI